MACALDWSLSVVALPESEVAGVGEVVAAVTEVGEFVVEPEPEVEPGVAVEPEPEVLVVAAVEAAEVLVEAAEVAALVVAVAAVLSEAEGHVVVKELVHDEL